MRRNNRAALPQLGADAPGLMPAGQVFEAPTDYSTAPNDELLSVDEAAALLGLQPGTVRKRIQRGEIPVVRLGYKTVRIKQSTIDRIIDEGSFLAMVEENMEAVHSGEEEMEQARKALGTGFIRDAIEALLAAAAFACEKGNGELEHACSHAALNLEMVDGQ